ncbi:MAG: SoxR reducing system RseC family protein [Zoogloea sp.]|uniref:SoxR reducing system RseC family protein n=1 Tax=Zoogloea sp. TaxID=49181 RepID=UPI0026168677|nr:SoxR reducing system RseC family protein [Zoogloea sp.]MDD2988606.1 SoxR reducing system RseC family protein [Zoogloea sp.]
MRAQGVVSRVEGDHVWVEVSVSGGCGRCHEAGGCGGVNIARPFGKALRVLRLHNDVDALPGERVSVVVDDGLPLRAALLAYGAPVLGVLAGAALGTSLAANGNPDLAAALGGGAGGVLMYLFGRARSGAAEGSMKIERIAGPSSVGGCGR